VGFFCFPIYLSYMKIIITKKQYKSLVYNLLDTITGGVLTVSQKEDFVYKSVYDSYGENVMDIFEVKGTGRNKGCKADMGVEPDFMIELQKYVPYFKNKIFSKVLIDYVYDKTGIKCDCVDYPTEYTEIDNNQNEYGFFNSRFAYNVKKKKKIRFDESVDDRQSLDEIIYDFLEDDYYPDYNWGPELFDFYRKDVKKHGSIDFYINDSEGYTYYSDGTLEIMPWVCEKLNGYFNDSWMPVFKSWFEEHSGLKVKRMIDSNDNTVMLSESNDKNKKFLISVMGMDFTDKIKQITSTYDVPMSFDDGIGPSTINMYLNHWGPMYLVNIDGENYLYQDRGSFEMFIDEKGYWNKDEIPEKLGIGVLGLRFSDIINMYFEEEE
jgi:hypothetical protein